MRQLGLRVGLGAGVMLGKLVEGGNQGFRDEAPPELAGVGEGNKSGHGIIIPGSQPELESREESGDLPKENEMRPNCWTKSMYAL